MCHQGTYVPNSGVLVAWMLMFNGTKDIISFFLYWVRDGSLAVSPAIMMTNWDLAQIGALKIVYLINVCASCHCVCSFIYLFWC
jgi:hypothetical protein